MSDEHSFEDLLDEAYTDALIAYALTPDEVAQHHDLVARSQQLTQGSPEHQEISQANTSIFRAASQRPEAAPLMKLLHIFGYERASTQPTPTTNP